MMHSPARKLRLLPWVCVLAGLTGLILASGCGGKSKNDQRAAIMPPPRYPTRPLREVPAYLQGTVLQNTDVAGTEPYIVSGYGLVTNLAGTGDSKAPTAVREYMLKEAARHGFGSVSMGVPVTPEQLLSDPRNAIVRVDASIPPGAARGDWMDLYVSSLPGNDTTSLARGVLYQTDLYLNGANPRSPGGVNVYVRGQGPIVVNPAHAISDASELDGTARASLRRGIVMDGGRSLVDRPLVLRLRTPQMSLSRSIEYRINNYFQSVKPDSVAQAQDEGTIHLQPPARFKGDWQHFIGLVTHLYLWNTPAFNAVKAKELAEAAVKPDAPLLDISYSWEGLGKDALFAIQPLMSHENPDVRFAAARAAAFLADPAAPQVLLQIAQDATNPNQEAAVEVLGALPGSPAINHMIRKLLDSPQSLVRIAAYRVLAKNRDPYLFTRVVGSPQTGEKFVVDIAPSNGPPLIYATTTGIPRIALLGKDLELELPIVFSAMGHRLTINSAEGSETVTVFYRPGDAAPVSVQCGPDLVELMLFLGGTAPERGARLELAYGQVVGILQSLCEAGHLVGVRDQKPTPVAFVLQERPAMQDPVQQAPVIPDAGRPQEEEPPAELGSDAVGMQPEPTAPSGSGARQ